MPTLKGLPQKGDKIIVQDNAGMVFNRTEATSDWRQNNGTTKKVAWH